MTPRALVAMLGIAISAALVLAMQRRRYDARETGWVIAAFIAHLISAVLQVLVTTRFYRGGDVTLYQYTGRQIARLIDFDPGLFLPRTLGLVFQTGDHVFPFDVIGAGASTGTMQGIAALIIWSLGDSLYVSGLVASLGAFFGQLALYRVFRAHVPLEQRRTVLLAALLVPSVVFWSSALLKESVAMAGLGWVLVAMDRFFRGERLRSLPVLFAGATPIALVKPYVLFALVLSSVVWWYWHRELHVARRPRVRLRPGYVVLAGVGAVVAMVLLGQVFPRYAFDNVIDEASRLQAVGAQVSGGSNYALAENVRGSPIGQLGFAPLALFTALFRPLIFEARNAPMFVNALEMTLLLLLFLRALWEHSWRSLWSRLGRSPLFVFAIAFVAVFGVAVGLASTNLGTLSRYRVPLVPFFAAVVLLLARGGPLPVWTEEEPGEKASGLPSSRLRSAS